MLCGLSLLQLVCTTKYSYPDYMYKLLYCMALNGNYDQHVLFVQ